jgi:hypothetical protein
MASTIFFSFGERELSLSAPLLSLRVLSQRLWSAKPPNRQILNFLAVHSFLWDFSLPGVLRVFPEEMKPEMRAGFHPIGMTVLNGVPIGHEFLAKT